MKRSDVQRLVAQLRDQQFEVELARSGHYKIRLDGVLVSSMAQTPSDWRSYRNQIANLKRCGFDPDLKPGQAEKIRRRQAQSPTGGDHGADA